MVTRALVVGGLAGAAWLLSASVAQAADKEPAAAGGAGRVPAPLTGVLEAAKPVLSTATGSFGEVLAPVAGAWGSAGRPAPTGVAPQRVVAGTATAVVAPSTTARHSIVIAGGAPATTPDTAARTPDQPGATAPGGPGDRSRTRASGLTGTLLGPVAPLGVTRALTVPGVLTVPVAQVALPVLAPVTVVLPPVMAMLRLLAAPFTGSVDAVNRTASDLLPGPRGRPTSAVTPVGDDGVHGLSGIRRPSGTTVPGPAATGPRASHTEQSVTRTHAAWRVERATAQDPGPSRRLPNPAPRRGQQGSLTGVPAHGPGSPVEGGAFATVPSSVAGSMMAFQLLPMPADVTVPRHDAEAPTVSPD